MKILFTIPHFYRSRAMQERSDGTGAIHGSEATNDRMRVRSLARALISIRQTFGTAQEYIGNLGASCNSKVAAKVEVVVCTTGDDHVVAQIPSALCRHHSTHAVPKLLGYECHRVLAQHLGSFDYYCFVEDDLLINDPLFFWKQRWFARAAGPRAVLQPHRFEVSEQLPCRKLYIDGPIRDPTIAPRFQDITVRPRLTGQILGVEVAFDRVENPHAGCFFLTNEQMRYWSNQPYFMDRAADFWGPLESAATLGVMRAFEVYKPSLDNAGFLEIQHLDPRYLGWLRRP